MATLTQNIKSRDWQLSTAGVGVLAEGLQDIRQCLDIILRTTKGTDPLRPEFGSDIYQYIDKPHNIAIPNIKKAIIEAASIWEKRIEIDTVAHKLESESQIDFFITYGLVDAELTDMLKLRVSGGFIGITGTATGALVVFAYFPPNPSNRRYTIDFIVNGNAAMPHPPTAGFATTTDLYNWVVANWSGYGTWQLAADRIIGRLNPSIVQTTSIQISLTGVLQFTGGIPNINNGQVYALDFSHDGTIETQQTFTTMGQMLQYVRNTYGGLGTWNIQGTPAIPGAFDPFDFDSNDFDTGTPALYHLILTSGTVNTATITVTAQ